MAYTITIQLPTRIKSVATIALHTIGGGGGISDVNIITANSTIITS